MPPWIEETSHQIPGQHVLNVEKVWVANQRGMLKRIIESLFGAAADSGSGHYLCSGIAAAVGAAVGKGAL